MILSTAVYIIYTFQDLLKHVWAADDFLLFKRLMTARNLELEMQAISLTHEKCEHFVQDLVL